MYREISDPTSYPGLLRLLLSEALGQSNSERDLIGQCLWVNAKTMKVLKVIHQPGDILATWLLTRSVYERKLYLGFCMTNHKIQCKYFIIKFLIHYLLNLINCCVLYYCILYWNRINIHKQGCII